MSDTPCWFQLNLRATSGQKGFFEADKCCWNYKESLILKEGIPIDSWPKDFWFQASKAKLEGKLEDVLRTSNLVLLFSLRLRAALDESQIRGIQYLPTKVLNSKREVVADYFVAIPTHLVNPLDERLCKLRTTTLKNLDGSSSEWISSIDHLVLKRPFLADFDILKIRGYPHPTFVSERWVRVFQTGGFSGISFDPVEVSAA